MKSEILFSCKITKANKWYLILECGHWYKWTGPKSPRVGTEIDCSECSDITVIRPGAIQ